MEQDNFAQEYLLAINTAEGYLQIAIGRSSQPSVYELVCSQEWRVVSQGAEMLVPLLASTCERLHITLHDIAKVACVTGPGSFTGIRLAISTVAGLARAREKALLQGALSLMPLLAKSVWTKIACVLPSHKQEKQGTLWVLTHARKNLVHIQGFEVGECNPYSIKPKTEVLVLSIDEVAALITSIEGRSILVGSGVGKNRDTLGLLLPDVFLLPDLYATVDPYVLVTSASSCLFSEADITPSYIRASDAEDSLESIATSLGLDPQQARAALERMTTTSEVL